MKTISAIFSTKFIVISLLVFYCSNAAASPQTQVKRLTHKLKSLPHEASSYSNVKPLVLTLTKLKPSKAFLYYKLGYQRLLTDQGLNLVYANKLFDYIRKILNRSDLSKDQIRNIVINISAYPGYIPPDPPYAYQAEQGAAANP